MAVSGAGLEFQLLHNERYNFSSAQLSQVMFYLIVCQTGQTAFELIWIAALKKRKAIKQHGILFLLLFNEYMV